MSTSNRILSDMIDIIRIRIWIRPQIWKQIWYRWYPSVSDPFSFLVTSAWPRAISLAAATSPVHSFHRLPTSGNPTAEIHLAATFLPCPLHAAHYGPADPGHHHQQAQGTYNGSLDPVFIAVFPKSHLVKPRCSRRRLVKWRTLPCSDAEKTVSSVVRAASPSRRCTDLRHSCQIRLPDILWNSLSHSHPFSSSSPPRPTFSGTAGTISRHSEKGEISEDVGSLHAPPAYRPHRHPTRQRATTRIEAAEMVAVAPTAAILAGAQHRGVLAMRSSSRI